MWKYISSSECSRWINIVIIACWCFMLPKLLEKHEYVLVSIAIWVVSTNTTEYINKRDREGK